MEIYYLVELDHGQPVLRYIDMETHGLEIVLWQLQENLAGIPESVLVELGAISKALWPDQNTPVRNLFRMVDGQAIVPAEAERGNNPHGQTHGDELPDPHEAVVAHPIGFLNVEVEGNVATINQQTRVVVDPHLHYNVTELSLWATPKPTPYQPQCVTLGQPVPARGSRDSTLLVAGRLLHNHVENGLRNRQTGTLSPHEVEEMVRKYFRKHPKERLAFTWQKFSTCQTQGGRSPLKKIADSLRKVPNDLHHAAVGDGIEGEVPFIDIDDGFDGKLDLHYTANGNMQIADLKLSPPGGLNDTDYPSATAQLAYYRAAFEAQTSILAPPAKLQGQHVLSLKPTLVQNVFASANVHRIRALLNTIRFERRNTGRLDTTLPEDSWAAHRIPRLCVSHNGEINAWSGQHMIVSEKLFLRDYCLYLHQMNDRLQWVQMHQAFSLLHRDLYQLKERHHVALGVRLVSADDTTGVCKLSCCAERDLTDIGRGSFVRLFEVATFDDGEPEALVRPEQRSGCVKLIQGVVHDRKLIPHDTASMLEYTVRFDTRNGLRPEAEKTYVMQEIPFTSAYDTRAGAIASLAEQARLREPLVAHQVPEWLFCLLHGKVAQDTGSIPAAALDQLREALAKGCRPDHAKAEICKWALDGRRIALILGPPGTGKTFLIAMLAFWLAKAGHKVRIATMTNNAALNIIDQLRNMWANCGAYATDMAQEVQGLVMWAGEERDDETTERLGDFSLRKIGVHDMTDGQIDDLKRGISILVGTNLSTYRHPVADSWAPEKTVAIIDEASQLTEGGTLLCLLGCERVIMVGDPKQLSPVCPDTDGIHLGTQSTRAIGYPLVCTFDTLKEAGVRNYSESFFERLLARQEEDAQPVFGRRVLTNVHRTSHTALVQVHSDLHYDGAIDVPDDPGTDSTLRFHVHHVGRGKCVSARRSDNQAKYVKALVAHENFTPANTHIIVPFNAQRVALELLLGYQWRGKVSTVDSFQGRDADNIIFNNSASKGALRNAMRLKTFWYSTRHDGREEPRNAQHGPLFVDSKLNVALSRPKEQFHLVADLGVLDGDVPDLRVPIWMEEEARNRVLQESPYQKLIRKLRELEGKGVEFVSELSLRAAKAEARADEILRAQGKTLQSEQDNLGVAAPAVPEEYLSRLKKAIAIDQAIKLAADRAAEEDSVARAINYAHLLEDAVVGKVIREHENDIRKSFCKRAMDGGGNSLCEPRPRLRLGGSVTLGTVSHILGYSRQHWQKYFEDNHLSQDILDLCLGFEKEKALYKHDEIKADGEWTRLGEMLLVANESRNRVAHSRSENYENIKAADALDNLRKLCRADEGLLCALAGLWQ